MKLQVIRQRSLWWSISLAIILAGIVAMILSWRQLGAPLRPSLDFVGGTRLQLELDCTIPNNCDKAIDPAIVRGVLDQENLGESSIQVLGQEKQAVSIRTPTLDVNQRTKLLNDLTQKVGKFDLKKIQIDTVGPTVGRQLFAAGMTALIVAFVGILIYLSLRFKLDYAAFAIIALFHDALITVGIFSILGLTLQVEVDSLSVVALLTIVGFSVHDTVVIYDRIRETVQVNPNRSINDIVEDAVDQTLARSINTTLTALLPLIGIFLFGGETLKYFALALIIGFIAGAYSSIFIASTLLAWWRVKIGQEFPTSESDTEALDSASVEEG